MEEQTKPDPYPGIKIGLTYNLKKENHSGTHDEEAEYDNIETIFALKNAFEKAGYHVELMEADDDLPLRLKNTKVDIVFNIAEGRGGRGREAQVPSLLNMMGIKFAGSDETTLCIALDKALTKRVLSTYKIKTPKFKVVSDIKKMGSFKGFLFPVIVKPNAEGSSKGISDVCIAEDITSLKNLLTDNITSYKQSMLVEEYIDGREFTVGILGNGRDTKVFRPMEIVYLDQNRNYSVYSFNVKQNYKKLIRYDCPAALDQQIEDKMIKTARKIYDTLECKDFSRMDFRLSNDNEIYFIEINPLPGLAPGYSDYPMLADFNGTDYDTLVQSIIYCALKRYNIRKG
ncbi:MAG: D-alanine--D-alanine ligase [Clostridiales bacterium GWF2_38_85]|nr:MAG: D-alanine--D-alanine ligase [Clostridiales bacterium GWF2_38_85]HBL83347.1 D-alanine--D-alanine ligase [Clostridiales bacterium]